MGAGIGEGGFVVNVGSSAWRNRKGKQEGVGFICLFRLLLSAWELLDSSSLTRPGGQVNKLCPHVFNIIALVLGHGTLSSQVSVAGSLGTYI